MKKLKSAAICVLLSIFCITTTAQISHSSKADYEKPALFFDLPPGQTIQIPFGRSFTLQGIIMSKSDANDINVKSVVIKLINRKGATLTFTRIRKNGNFSYIGRMLSYHHSDAYEIKLENGQYFLTKKKSLDIINE
ncbi:MAG: hypothetical protein ABR503_05805 [Chitinophagaceae bacterium]